MSHKEEPMPDHDDKPDTTKHPPGGVADQLIDPDVEPVEPTPEARRTVARFEEIKRTPRPHRLFLECCRALGAVFHEYTDRKLHVATVDPGDEGPRGSARWLAEINEHLGPRYRVVDAEQPDGILVPDMTPEQAEKLARELAKWAREEPGRLEVIKPSDPGPPLGRPTPLNASTGAPMTPERVREVLEYLREAEVVDDDPRPSYCLQTPWTDLHGRAENARRVLLWLLDGPGQLPVAEPCEHDETFASVDDISRWCTRCGALRVDGEWRLPGTAPDA
jgi:hypothetical protein